MNRKFIKHLILISISCLLLASLLVILFDPFYMYHKPLPFLKAVLEERDYEVMGTLRNFEYDSVILGTSVAENYNNHWFDEAFQVTSVKAMRASGRNSDLLFYLEEAYKHQEISHVFYSVDLFSIFQPTTHTFEEEDYYYLINNTPFDDFKYLWNKDIILKKIPLQLAYSFFLDYDEGESYNWYQEKTFSKEAMMTHYFPLSTFAPMQEASAIDPVVMENILALKDMILEHPETEFQLFFPPSSILWWDNEYRSGTLEIKLEAIRLFVTELAPLDNVSIYYYQNDESLIKNLDLYMDSVHFNQTVNKTLVEKIKENQGLIKKELLDETLTDLLNSTREMVTTYATKEILQDYPTAVTP